MSVFDDALDTLHDQCDAFFTDDAVFHPASGSDVACKVERFLPETEFGLESAKAVVADFVLKVVKAGLPRPPAQGDRFIIGADTYRVLAKAKIEDDDGRRYSVKVEAA